MTRTHPQRKRNPLLVGCLVAVAVVVLAAAAAAYYFFGRPALAVYSASRDIARIQRLDNGVTNRATFTPPNDDLLTQQQLDRYLAVTRQVRDGLQSEMAILVERYSQISIGSAIAPALAGFRQASSAWAEILKLVVKAKETQVAAINQGGFSLSEYRWVRTQVMNAAGIPLVEVDFNTLVRLARNQSLSAPTVTPPQANVDLVAPHATELSRIAPLAVFGL